MHCVRLSSPYSVHSSVSPAVHQSYGSVVCTEILENLRELLIGYKTPRLEKVLRGVQMIGITII